MLKIDFLENYLTKVFNQDFIGNKAYQKELQTLLTDSSTTAKEKNLLRFILKAINNKSEKCFNEASIIVNENSKSSPDIIYTIFFIEYVFLLIRLFIQSRINLKESNLKDYIRTTFLQTRLSNNEELCIYSWIPDFLDGYIYSYFDKDYAIEKFRNSIRIAGSEYRKFPLSMVYDKLGLLLYEKGYFDSALKVYTEAVKEWPTSTYILNNNAFLHFVLKDEKALKTLQEVLDLSRKDDPYPAFNLASYKLLMFNNGNCNMNIEDVPILLKQAYQNFIKEYKIYQDKAILLDVFPCAVLENIAQSNQSNIESKFSTLPISEQESIGAKDLLLNLFCDLENFITDSITIMENLSNFLDEKKTIKSTEDIFIVLKRWSSYTPLIPRNNSQIRGGGHFFSWKGNGFIIDPGPSFLENFVENGYRLSDIDCIICSHGHVDHTQDLERIITLLYEKNDRNIPQKIRLILSPGCASKYGSLLSASSDVIESSVVLYPDKEITINDLEISIKPALANHNEIFSRKDTALSFIIKLYDHTNLKFQIGFTNDTGFINAKSKTIESFFSEKIDLLIANLGSDSFARLAKLANFSLPKTWLRELNDDKEIYNKFKDTNILNTLGYKNFSNLEKMFFIGKECKDYEWYDKHLGFRGLFRLAMNCNYQFLIISEFGEELKNYRHLFAKSLNKTLDKKGKIITGDVGTKFKLLNNRILPFCEVKNDYINSEIVEKIVKNEDFRVIHFDKKILNRTNGMEILQSRFGYLI